MAGNLNSIACMNLAGDVVMVDADRIEPTTRIYGVFIREHNHQKELLTVTIGSIQKYYLPGGGQEIGESDVDTLRRESREELGIETEVGNIIYTDKIYFYHDSYKKAWLATIRIYTCTALTELNSNFIPDDLEAESPAWRKIDDLTHDDFQKGIRPAIQAILDREKINAGFASAN